MGRISGLVFGDCRQVARLRSVEPLGLACAKGLAADLAR
jgi:hypothetical protein